MKTMKKILCVLLAVLTVCFGFAACSSSSDNTADSSDTAAEETAKVKVIDIDLTEEEYAFGVDKDQPDLLKSTNDFIAKIQGDGTFDAICNKYFGDGTPEAVTSAKEDSTKDQLVVATNAAFEPFEYTQGDSYYGIDMEIAKLLADELGKELVIKNMDFDSVCLSVGQHKADIAMAGLTVKPDREKYVTFSTSYYTASQRIIVTGDNTEFDACKTADEVVAILNAKDKASTKIGVQNGTTAQFYVEGDADWGFDGVPAQCVGYKNGSLAVQDLINGNLNYVIIDSAPASCITDAINAVA